MKKKRLLSLALAACMVCAMFSGCSSDSSSEASSAGAGSSAAAPEDITFPLAEPVTINVMLPNVANIKDPGALEFFQQREAATNVKIEWETVPTGWTERKSLMFAAGQVPDAIFSAKAFTNADVIKNASFFEPLEGYIDQYCPNIKKMFEERPDLKKNVTAADGHIYALPQVMPLRPETRNIMFINQDWLDAVGMSMPETTDEFYEVLKAFKTQDPNGNGQADEIPFIFDGIKPANGITSLFGAFGLSENTTGDWVMVENGKVSYMMADERLKDAVNYANKLYSEGLIDQEVFTQTVSQMNGKLRSAEIATVGCGYGWTIEASMNNAERAAQYTELPPLKGPNGDQLWRPSTVMSGDNVAFLMSKNNPHKEITMKWIDQFYDPEIGIQLYFGPVGTCLEIGEDGKYTILPPPADSGMTEDAWMWKNGLNDRSPIYISEEFEQKINWNNWVSEKLDADAVYAPYAAKVEELPPSLQYSKEEVSELNTIQAELTNFSNQKVAQWIVNGNIEEEWEDYQKQLEMIGMPRMLEIIQGAYDRYKA